MEAKGSQVLYFLAFAAGLVFVQCQASDESSSQENSTDYLKKVADFQLTSILPSEAATPTLRNVPLNFETQVVTKIAIENSVHPQPTAAESVATSENRESSLLQPPVTMNTSSRSQGLIVASAVNDNPTSSSYISTSSEIVPSMNTLEQVVSQSAIGISLSQSRDIKSPESLESLKASVSMAMSSLETPTSTPPLASETFTMESKLNIVDKHILETSYIEDTASASFLPVDKLSTPASMIQSSVPLDSLKNQAISTLDTSITQVLVAQSVDTSVDTSAYAGNSSIRAMSMSLLPSGSIRPTSVISTPTATWTEVTTPPWIGYQNGSAASLNSTIGHHGISSNALNSDTGSTVHLNTVTSSLVIDEFNPATPSIERENSTNWVSGVSKDTTEIQSFGGFSTGPSNTTETLPSEFSGGPNNTTETLPSEFSGGPNNTTETLPSESSGVPNNTTETQSFEFTAGPKNTTETQSFEFTAGPKNTTETQSIGFTDVPLSSTLGKIENDSVTVFTGVIRNLTTLSLADVVSNSTAVTWNETLITSSHSGVESHPTTPMDEVPVIPWIDQNATVSDTIADNVTTASPLGFNDTDVKPVYVKPTQKTPTSTKAIDENEIHKTDKVPVVTVLTSHMSLPAKTTVPVTPPSNQLQPDLKPTDKVMPTVYISLNLRMTWPEFCPNIETFQLVITNLLLDHKKQVISINQVEIKDKIKCLRRGFYRYHPMRRSSDISIDFYIVDPKGFYDEVITKMVADILENQQVLLDELEDTAFHGKVLSVKVYGYDRSESDSRGTENKEQAIGVGITVGIVIAALVGLCVIGFIIFQIAVMRKRRGVKKMRYSYSNSRYSLDVHSIHEAIQLTGVSRREDRFAYINPGLVADDKDLSSNPLTMDGLENMLKNVDLIEEEFLMLPNIIPKLTDVPQGAEDKNRYANVIPIPETRVVLNRKTEEEGGDYINANFVRGHLCSPESYIATQAPMEHTKGDFWQMVWDQQCQVIIMLTGLEEHGIPKCAEYWPNTVGGDIVRVYDFFEVTKRKREVKPEWILSILKLKNLKTKQTRDVVHFWLTAWPIDGMPDCKTVINFLMEVRPYMEYGAGPTVVHCSPGNGRTGTLLATDIQLLSYDDTKMVDILSCLHRLREDRAGAVQTKEQYLFIYKVLQAYAKMLNSRHTSNASSVASINIAA